MTAQEHIEKLKKLVWLSQPEYDRLTMYLVKMWEDAIELGYERGYENGAHDHES